VEVAAVEVHGGEEVVERDRRRALGLGVPGRQQPLFEHVDVDPQGAAGHQAYVLAVDADGVRGLSRRPVRLQQA
jgi:hypothetical protein